MRILTTAGVVHANHTLTIQVPPDIPCGTHEVVVVINSTPPPSAVQDWRLPVHDVGPWPEGFTVRREDIYGDDGDFARFAAHIQVIPLPP